MDILLLRFTYTHFELVQNFKFSSLDAKNVAINKQFRDEIHQELGSDVFAFVWHSSNKNSASKENCGSSELDDCHSRCRTSLQLVSRTVPRANKNRRLNQMLADQIPTKMKFAKLFFPLFFGLQSLRFVNLCLGLISIPLKCVD